MTDAELIARLHKIACHIAADRIEALTKELAIARQDAKAAEDELEMQEQEACMMEDDYIKLEKESDAIEAKLEKAVMVLNALDATLDRNGWHFASIAREDIRAILAEIKGETK